MRRLQAPPPPSAWLLSLCVLAAVFLLAPLGARAQADDADALVHLARDFMQPAVQALSTGEGATAMLRPEVEIGTLDRRLRLAPCARVEAHLPKGSRLWGRSRVGLRCVDGPTRWNVYLPVTVKVFGPAWVLRRPVASGAILTEEDAEQADTDWAAHPATVIADAGQWIGQKAAFNLQPGQALRQNMVRAAPVFAAGALVKVSSGGQGFEVVITGEALTPGLTGQTTRVRLPGGKVVSGLVQDDQSVRLGL